MGRHVPVIAGLLLAASLSLGGCAWRGPMPAQTWPEVESSKDVITLDEAAYKLVAVQNKKVERTADGRLQVRLELANLSAQDLPVQVQTLYRDESGMLLQDSSPFEMVVLPGNGSKLYQSAALNASATSFTVQIKTP